jgi:hypothetical protein
LWIHSTQLSIFTFASVFTIGWKYFGNLKINIYENTNYSLRTLSTIDRFKIHQDKFIGAIANFDFIALIWVFWKTTTFQAESHSYQKKKIWPFTIVFFPFFDDVSFFLFCILQRTKFLPSFLPFYFHVVQIHTLCTKKIPVYLETNVPVYNKQQVGCYKNTKKKTS